MEAHTRITLIFTHMLSPSFLFGHSSLSTNLIRKDVLPSIRCDPMRSRSRYERRKKQKKRKNKHKSEKTKKVSTAVKGGPDVINTCTCVHVACMVCVLTSTSRVLFVRSATSPSALESHSPHHVSRSLRPTYKSCRSSRSA